MEDEKRNELRKRLRNKIKGKREDTGSSFAHKVKNDPKGALLSMGIEDVNLIEKASTLIKNPSLEKVKAFSDRQFQNKKEEVSDEECLPENMEES